MNGGVYGRELIITVIGTQDTADRIRPVMAQLLRLQNLPFRVGNLVADYL
jgi:hypothetical protein